MTSWELWIELFLGNSSHLPSQRAYCSTVRIFLSITIFLSAQQLHFIFCLEVDASLFVWSLFHNTQKAPKKKHPKQTKHTPNTLNTLNTLNTPNTLNPQHTQHTQHIQHWHCYDWIFLTFFSFFPWMIWERVKKKTKQRENQKQGKGKENKTKEKRTKGKGKWNRIECWQFTFWFVSTKQQSKTKKHSHVSLFWVELSSINTLLTLWIHVSPSKATILEKQKQGQRQRTLNLFEAAAPYCSRGNLSLLSSSRSSTSANMKRREKTLSLICSQPTR